MDRSISKKVYNELCQLIPGGVNSPVRSCLAMGQLPMVVDRGEGDEVVDVDGHRYIDYCGSWGALIHGHAHPQILDAVQRRMQKGTSFGITTAIEAELAREVIQLIDSIEKIRFVNSGTEATMSAIRLARGFTQKKLIIKFSGNYHGHADFFLIQAGSGMLDVSPTASSAGVPEEVIKQTICLPYNDIEACRALFNQDIYRSKIAAVILEPVAGNMGVIPAELDFLQFLREETTQMGALLIFDEVMTGFRIAKRGAQDFYGVKPDLTCFGKIIGGGFPVAAFGGREEIMNYLAPLGPVYQAGTLSGNPIAMEAGLQSLRLLQQPGFYETLQHKTNLLVFPIKQKIEEKGLNACIQQAGAMFTLFFGKKQVRHLADVRECHAERYAQLFRFLFKQGIYIPPSSYEAWFMSAAHQEKNLEKTAKAVIQFIEETEN
jgi:glutamate-1-semialdehyde 2,1-aminomutase